MRTAQCYLKLRKKKLVEEALSKVHECLENNSTFLSSKKGINFNFKILNYK